MELQQRLEQDMRSAMKAGQRDRLGVIRMLLNEVKNADLAAKPTTPGDAVEAYAKRLRKSREEYEKLGKTPEVQKLNEELAVVEEFLPKKASAEETERRVDEFLSDKSFGEKQFGQAMGQFMKQHGQDMDAAAVSQILRRKLAGK
jgi:uncharacterized protein